MSLQALPDDILLAVRSMVDFCEEREYVKASDKYIQVSIGNAAWPIGACFRLCVLECCVLYVCVSACGDVVIIGK